MKCEPTCEVVIPARLASTRLPEKLLLSETGKTVLQHTYERACQARLPARITIAVDSQQIAAVATKFGANAIMTSSELPSGTDRVAAVATEHSETEIFINVQGDEPEIAPESIDQVARMLVENTDADVATLAAPIRCRERLENPACVKVVQNSKGEAMYFSRSPIPHARCWDEELLQSEPPLFLQHIGIYAYRRTFLQRLGHMPASAYEDAERLEQLRFLNDGARIVVGETRHVQKGIDTPDDYRDFVHRFYANSRIAA